MHKSKSPVTQDEEFSAGVGPGSPHVIEPFVHCTKPAQLQSWGQKADGRKVMND